MRHKGPNWIKIQTDPRNTAYRIIGGAREKVETWDPVENGGIVLQSAEEKKRLETDAFFKLETTTRDATIAQIKKLGVESLLEANSKTWSDPYTLNCALRKRLRVCVCVVWIN
jgi:coiled-coil domain-containing protein 130